MPRDLSIFAGVIALGAYAVAEGVRLDGASGLFPAGLGVVLMASAGLALARAWVRGAPEADIDAGASTTIPPAPHAGRVQAVGLALLAGYIVAAGQFGLLSAALVFMPGLAWIAGHERRWRLLAPVTVVFVCVLYGLFFLALRLPLPRELVFG